MAALARIPVRSAAPTKHLNLFACSTQNIFPPFSRPSPHRALHTRRDFYINGRWTAPAVARDYHVMHPLAERFLN
jgi:hypothetical protein